MQHIIRFNRPKHTVFKSCCGNIQSAVGVDWNKWHIHTWDGKNALAEKKHYVKLKERKIITATLHTRPNQHILVRSSAEINKNHKNSNNNSTRGDKNHIIITGQIEGEQMKRQNSIKLHKMEMNDHLKCKKLCTSQKKPSEKTNCIDIHFV